MKFAINYLKRDNIFFYMFTISAVVILAIVMIGINLYQACHRTVYDDFVKSQELYLKEKMDHHENDMRVLDDIMKRIGFNSDNTRFCLKNQPLKAIELIEDLNGYQSVSQFFEKICYHYHGDDYMYDQTTSMEISWFLENLFGSDEEAKQEFEKRCYSTTYGWNAIAELQLLRNNTNFYRTTRIRSDSVVIWLKTIPTYYDSTMFFLAPGQYYDQLLSNMIHNTQGQQSFCIILEDQVIVQRGNEKLEEKVLLAEISGFLGTKEVTLGKEHYLVTVQQGDSGLFYCVFQSMDIFYNKLKDQQRGLLALLVLCMMMTILLIVSVFKRMAFKIIRVNSLLNPEENCCNIGDIESGIEMLISVKNRYERENLQSKKAFFIRNFIRGDYEDETKLRLDAAQAGVSVKGGLYAVVLSGERGDQGVSRARDKILSLIKETQEVDGYGISLVGSNQDMFVLFADNRERMENVILEIFQTGQEYCEDFVMSISDYHTALMEGSEAYLEANNAFDNRFLQSNDSILRFEKETGGEKINILSENYLQSLRHALQRRDETLLKSTVEDMCQRVSQSSNNLLAFRLNYNKIVQVLVMEWSTDRNKWKEIYNVFALSQCLTMQDFSDLLYDTCREIMYNNIKQEPVGEGIVEHAIACMKERYTDFEFNMAMLAEELSVSAVTLSVTFKNTLGIRPSDYLAYIRMEEAKRLLTDTELLIRDVSIAVGYEDDHVFTRRFKKYTGCTPSQYRADRDVSENRRE